MLQNYQDKQEKKSKSRRQTTINQGVTPEYHELVGTVDFSTCSA
jgi:hypothetical protein